MTAGKAEEVGLDVFATGEHHNPLYTFLTDHRVGFHRCATDQIMLSTSTKLVTTNDLVKIAEDFATLQHPADGRIELVLGLGIPVPSIPGSVRTIGWPSC